MQCNAISHRTDQFITEALKRLVCTLYEGLFEGVGDADEVSALVDAVGSSLRPRSHGKVVEQVAVVVKRVGRPGATFIVPSYEREAHGEVSSHPGCEKGCVHHQSDCVQPGPEVGGWGGGPCPFAVERGDTSIKDYHFLTKGVCMCV